MVTLSCGALDRRSVETSTISGSGLHLVEHFARPFGELCDVRVLQRVLECGARDAAADGDVLRRLEIGRYSGHLGELRPQAVDDLRGVEIALFARLEDDVEASGVCGLAEARSRPDEATSSTAGSARMTWSISRCRRIISCGEISWAPSEMPLIRPMSWIGKKPFRHVDHHDAGQRHGDEEHRERDRLVAQHDVERAPIERQQQHRSRFDDPIERPW